MLNIQEIKEIIKLIDQSSIDEFTYETNGTSITMKKAAAGSALAVQPVVQAAPAVPEAKQETAVQAAPAAPIQTQESAPEQKAQADYDYEIVSPMVGTLYRASNPESDPFVSVGSKVNKNTTVCIVEAMKLFNEIEAEVDGEIVEILAEDGELVEFGQPLFRVKKN